MARQKVHPEGVNKYTYALPESLKEQVDDLAWRKRISASELVRVALNEYIDREDSITPEPAGVS